MKSANALAITAPAAKALSPAQKKFNTLIKRMQFMREELALWEQAVPQYRERHVREFLPMVEAYRGLSADFVRALHAAHGRKGLTKTERATLSDLIVREAGAVVDGTRNQALCEEMKQIYNQHAEEDFEVEEAENAAMAREMAREIFGVEVPEDLDLNSPEELLRHFQQQSQQAQDQQDEAPPRPAAKPSRAQQKEAEQQQEASQTLREVYRKLASQLHPDREPDPAERARKTALMQRVNDAYAQKRLLDLLQLQLEAEQIDAEHIANLSEQRLKHYNRVLGAQLKELEEEIRASEAGFCFEFQFDPGPHAPRLKPAYLPEVLQIRTADLTQDTQRLRKDLARVDDQPTFKHWLKRQRQALRDEERMDDLLSLLGR